MFHSTLSHSTFLNNTSTNSNISKAQVRHRFLDSGVCSPYAQLGKLARLICGLIAVCSFGGANCVSGQESGDGNSQKENFEKFEKMMTNVKLVGSFTIIGDEEKKLREETYIIESAKKMDEGNKWLIKARIKYGDLDFSAPMPLDVEWAGDTPVISLTDLTIPTLGTFSARVVFYNGKYAGTWTHGEVGGHLFGRLLPNDGKGDAESKDDDKAVEDEKGEMRSKRDSDKADESK